MFECFVALIIAIATEMGVPPNFALAIALAENDILNPKAYHLNENGTNDVGIFQLNSEYYSHIDRTEPEVNIRTGIAHIRMLMDKEDITMWWQIAIAYNAGYGRMYNPPNSSINYALRVMNIWLDLDGLSYRNPMIRNKK